MRSFRLCFAPRWGLALMFAGTLLLLSSEIIKLKSDYALLKKVRVKIDPPSSPALHTAPPESVVLTSHQHAQSVHQGSSGYVLTVHFTGQQNAGLGGIFSQQCWIHAFGLQMKMVVPFVNHSRFRHTPEDWSSVLGNHSSSMRLSDLHDINYFNNQSIRDGDPPLVSFEQFLQEAPRQIIVLQIDGIHRRQCLSYPVEKCMSGRNATAFHLFTSGTCGDADLTSPFNALTSYGFEIVRTVCLNCLNVLPHVAGISPEEITEFIFGPHKSSNITLLVANWKYTINLTPTCKRSSFCKAVELARSERTIPSQRLEEHINQYTKLLKTERTVAFVFRFEWALIAYRNSSVKRISKCLDEALGLYSVDMKYDGNKSINRRPILAADIGRYGSVSTPYTLRRYNPDGTIFPQIVNRFRDFILELFSKDSGWTFDDWEKSFTDSVGAVAASEPGYIAALQSALASRSDCIVLMGGGHFQMAIVEEYVKRHSEICVHFVCMPSTWESALNSVLS